MTTPNAGTPGTGQPSGDQGATPPNPPTGQPVTNPPADQAGGDVAKLQATLAKERELRRTAEKAARELDAAKARVAELEQATQSDTEKAVTAARREAAAEAMGKANGRLVAAEARALAAEAKFRDPRDAARFLELGDVRVAEDGTVDTDAIAARLKALAEEKPYLLQVEQVTPPEPQGPRPPRPDPSQGSGRQPAPTGADKGLAEAQRRFGNRAAAGAGSN